MSADSTHSEKVAEEWPKVPFWARKREPLRPPKSFTINQKCSKEDSNLHRFPY